MNYNKFYLNRYLMIILISIFLSMFLTCSGEENDLLEAPNGISIYKIRDTGPAGGIVFYDKGYYSNGWRYLEAAPSDQSESAEWGCEGSLITGADGTEIGTGMQNTNDIINGCSTEGKAADICSVLVLGGYDDWFLPSIDELELMLQTMKDGYNINYYDSYWSSSENSADWAWYSYIASESSNHYGLKSYIWNRVRAIRSF